MMLLTLERTTIGSSRRTLVAAVCLLAFILVPLRLHADCQVPTVTDQWQLDVRDVDRLYGRLGTAEMVSFRVDTRPSSGAGKLESVGHVHALYDAPLEIFADALGDLEGQAEFLPRLARAEILCEEGADERYTELRQRLSFQVLFFRRDYEYVLHYMSESTIEEQGRFRSWWELDRSVDGQVAATDGSWLLERVVVNGRELTYVAYSVRTAFNERPTGLATVLRRFGARDMKRIMDSLADEVRGRAAGT